MAHLDPDIARHIADRARIAAALGSPEDRKLARLRLGLTQIEVAEATGMSLKAVRLREKSDPLRRRIDVECEVRYAELIAMGRGIRL